MFIRQAIKLHMEETMHKMSVHHLPQYYQSSEGFLHVLLHQSHVACGKNIAKLLRQPSLYIYIYIYIYFIKKKQQTGHIRIINLFPSCYTFLKILTDYIKENRSGLSEEITLQPSSIPSHFLSCIYSDLFYP